MATRAQRLNLQLAPGGTLAFTGIRDPEVVLCHDAVSCRLLAQTLAVELPVGSITWILEKEYFLFPPLCLPCGYVLDSDG